MSTKNPLTYGFRAIGRDPVLLLTEILWRWCFGAVAVFLLFGFLAMQPGALSADDTAAWRTRDPMLISQALLHLLTRLGGGPLRTSFGLLLTATAIWMLLGAIGRTLTLNRLEPGGVNFRSILALQSLRALFLWLAVFGLVGALAWDARLSGRGGTPDVFLDSALTVWSAILIGAVWLIVNWHLSLAAICCAKNAGSSARSIRQALGLARSHSGDLLGVSLVFALWRLLTLAVAFVLWFLPSAMLGTAPRAYFAWVVTITLAYFAASDLLYIARMAGYLVIDPLESAGKEIAAPISGGSGNKPIAF